MKDAYYFPHDSNAMNDPKVIVLIGEMGMEGYGIYWSLIEHLREQPDYTSTILILKGLAIRMQTTESKVAQVVRNFGLFIIQDDLFTSPSLLRRMEPYDRKKIQAREAINTRWKRERDKKALEPHLNTDVLQPNFERDTSKVKESKVKESKEEKRRPTLDEVKEFFLSKSQAPSLASSFWDHYESNGWKVGKNPMQKWKAAASGWISREKDFSKSNNIPAEPDMNWKWTDPKDWQAACKLWRKNGWVKRDIPGQGTTWIKK